MIARLFAWLAGLALVLVFLVIISPDLFRGYVFSQEERSSGRQVYETYCIGCHGDTGLGDGEASVFLNPKPRNFVKGDYKYFHFSESGPFPSDQSLEITIRNGIPGSSMPAFPLLSDQEIGEVNTYLKSLHQAGWQEPAPIQAAGEPVQVVGQSGEELFQAGGCNACHQLDALGATGGVGPSLNQVGSRLSPEEIEQSITDPDAVIAEICPAGPCLGGVMPQDFADRLTDEQLDTLATYLSALK